MALSSAQLRDPNCEVTDSDYDTILSAIMETSRGRWFLSEFARRNRYADTNILLSALNNIKETLDFFRRASRPNLIKTVAPSASAASPADKPAASGMSVVLSPYSKTISYSKTAQAPIAPGNAMPQVPRIDVAARASFQSTVLCAESGAFEFK